MTRRHPTQLPRAAHLRVVRSPESSLNAGPVARRPFIQPGAGTGAHRMPQLGPEEPYIGRRRAPDSVPGRFFEDPEAPVDRDEICLLIANVRRLMQRRFNDITSTSFAIKPRRVKPADYQCAQYDQFRWAEPAAGARLEQDDYVVRMDLAVRVREQDSPHYRVSMLSFFGFNLVGRCVSFPDVDYRDIYSSTRFKSRILAMGNGEYQEVDELATSEPVTTHQARAAFNLMRGAAGFPANDFSKIPPVPPHELAYAFASMELPLAAPSAKVDI